ncbi:MAG: 2-succinyl-5-enolpyruvyl-6-hydroxy-3-cyclohexene-1-carboxylic-acid synthase [Sulfuricella sp.]
MTDDTARDNVLWAWTLIDALAASGVAHAVISPGSRSTPLALACLRHPGVEVSIQVDERSAAFFALGLVKARHQPVVLVCTSGSAPAHWYPAVIEADMGGTPLILLSADRPPELRGCGANQATDQNRLFGSHVRAFHELPCADSDPEMLRWLRALAAQVADQSRWPLAGPVHVNVPLREPLLPDGPWPALQAAPVAAVSYPVMSLPPVTAHSLADELAGGRGLIVCGAGVFDAEFSAALAELAHKLACPVLADPLANLRFGAHCNGSFLSRYDAFLRGPDAPRPEWVLRFGAMPVSKSLQRFLDGLADVPQLLVECGGRWPDPLHRASRLLRADPAALCRQLSALVARAASPAWLETFVAAERLAAQLAELDPPPEADVVRTLIELLPAGATLFCGNSMSIRDLDAYSGCGAKALRVVGNRGASGIDGNVSTALGLAAAGAAPLVALLGDLAFYHDMNGLAAARGLDVVFVVLNNGGGGIFEYLPQAGLEEFERGWLTPLALDFSHVAALYGLSHVKVEHGAGFSAALAAALEGGAHLVEVSIDRAGSVARHRAYWEAAAQNMF